MYEYKRCNVWIPCSLVCKVDEYGTHIIGYTHDGMPYQTRANIYLNLRKV